MLASSPDVPEQQYRPTSTTRDDAMMATMRLISSTPEAYRTYHFYSLDDVGAMLPPKICYNQSINQSINIFIANSQLSIIIYYTAKTRAHKFYAGLLQMVCMYVCMYVCMKKKKKKYVYLT